MPGPSAPSCDESSYVRDIKMPGGSIDLTIDDIYSRSSDGQIVDPNESSERSKSGNSDTSMSIDGDFDESDTDSTDSDKPSEIHELSGKAFSTTRGKHVRMTITQDTGAEGWYVTEWLLEKLKMDHKPLARNDETLLKGFGPAFRPAGVITLQWHAINNTAEGRKRGPENRNDFYVIPKKFSHHSIDMLLGRDALQELNAITYHGISILRKSKKKRTAGKARFIHT
jgi:hypothetical protein